MRARITSVSLRNMVASLSARTKGACLQDTVMQDAQLHSSGLTGKPFKFEDPCQPELKGKVLQGKIALKHA